MGDPSDHAAPTEAAERPPLLYEDLTEQVRQTAFEVHRFFGGGFLEAVYRNALRSRLIKQGLNAEPQRYTIRDEDGTVVGVYEADLVVEQKVLTELKAGPGLRPEHDAQTLNYLKASGVRVGLLINFGRQVIQVRRLVL
jgi:GxxExxY protein